MSGSSRQTSFLSPASISIHDDGNVLRYDSCIHKDSSSYNHYRVFIRTELLYHTFHELPYFYSYTAEFDSLFLHMAQEMLLARHLLYVFKPS